LQYKKVKYYLFLKDVLWLAFTAFGGPQAHLAMLFDLMVTKRRYLTEEELVELNALCTMLPGPSSTQTITAIGFRIGGPALAYLTLLVWVLPAATLMTIAAIMFANLQAKDISLDFTRFVQPMAIGFVAYAGYKITRKVVKTKTAVVLMIIGAVASILVRSPFIFPAVLLFSGAVTALKFKSQPKEVKIPFHINWSNFFLWAGVLIGAALLGALTKYKPILLFENFYRNGSMIFGGGQVLIPYLYTEFVEFKNHLTSAEFLSGYGAMQAMPGPIFSFCAFIGSLSMREFGTSGEILGAVAALAGIFLPGTFLIFFVIRFWDSLKKYRLVRASLEGINAASAGLVIAATILMFIPIEASLQNIGIVIGTFLLLLLTKIPSPVIVMVGFLAGIFIKV
jgi:chromate transporter